MSSIVCQGLQSCLDSPIIEQTTLRLKLASPKPHFSKPKEFREKCHFKETETSKTTDSSLNSLPPNPKSGCWNFAQLLLDSSSGPKQSTSFVHHSHVKLSEKSLELCTETLGCETGSDVTDNTVFWPCSSNSGKKEKKSTNRKLKSREFPPPLTTISGSGSLLVRPHREDGRLIIKAVFAQSNSCFQAERSDGRLRLRLLKNPSDSGFDSDGENEVEEEEGKGEAQESDADGNNFEAEGKMGMESFQRASRCKEEPRLFSWEPLWVTTS